MNRRTFLKFAAASVLAAGYTVPGAALAGTEHKRPILLPEARYTVLDSVLTPLSGSVAGVRRHAHLAVTLRDLLRL